MLLADVFRAYYDARKNKRNTSSQLKFEMNLETNLVGLVHEIESRQYEVGRSICFIVDKPVKREVFAAAFRDRVVHHLLFNYLSPMIERTFIHDCYSCRKGYGTLCGINRVAGNIRKCTHNFTRDAYVQKLDISGYFMSINRKILLDKLFAILTKYADRKCGKGNLKWNEYIDYETIKYLLVKVVLNNPVDECIFRGDRAKWQGLPKTKSLFFAKKGCGLPIGNLTSQLFSNVYLSDFDNYMKRDEHIKYYGRYVDDIIMINSNRQKLNAVRNKVRNMLSSSLGLYLHPNKIYLQSVSKGFEFLGMRQREAILTPGKRMKHNLESVLTNYLMSISENITYGQVLLFRSKINSYIGLLKHCASKSYINKIGVRLFCSGNAYLLMDVQNEKTVINERDIIDAILS
jgi:retron-type reverse transcriptase